MVLSIQDLSRGQALTQDTGHVTELYKHMPNFMLGLLKKK
jgi:hypothetical protein